MYKNDNKNIINNENNNFNSIIIDYILKKITIIRFITRIIYKLEKLYCLDEGIFNNKYQKSSSLSI